MLQGTQMKSIEDDPSITPGSVVRSPLSLATIKDTEIFSSGGKTSPTVSGSEAIPPISLINSTWSFNPPATTASSSFTRCVPLFILTLPIRNVMLKFEKQPKVFNSYVKKEHELIVRMQQFRFSFLRQPG